MSKAEDNLHYAVDPGVLSERSKRQGPGINHPSFGNNFNPATCVGILGANAPNTGFDLNLDSQDTEIGGAGHLSSFVSNQSSGAFVSPQLNRNIDQRSLLPAGSTDTDILISSPALNEDRASTTHVPTVPFLPLAIRAIAVDRALYQHESPLSLQDADQRISTNTAGRFGQATTQTEAHYIASTIPQDKNFAVPALREAAEGRATGKLKSNEVASTLAHMRKDETSQSFRARKEMVLAKKRSDLHLVSASRVTKGGRRPGHQFEMQWRVGQAPRNGMPQNQEQMHYENILSAIVRYYSGNAETNWKLALSHSTAKLDQNFETLHFLGLTVTAAGLVMAGRSVQAHEALNQIAPAARTMLLSHHPMTFWLLIDQVMDTSQTVLGNLRVAITPRLASLPSSLLGPSHPLTILFKTPLTTEQKIQLRLQAQMVVHNEMARVFGPYAYQTFIQYGYYARTVMSSGRAEEALRMLSEVNEVLDRHYGLNSAMSTLGMIEQARQQLASGSSSVMLECMLGDLLRRNHILYTGSGNSHDDSMDIGENTLRRDYLLALRIVALRLLGRLHARRRSFGAAIFHFDVAVATARPLLIPGSNTMRMCEADQALAKLLEDEQAMGILGGEDPYDRFTSPFSVTPWIPREDKVRPGADPS